MLRLYKDTSLNVSKYFTVMGKPEFGYSTCSKSKQKLNKKGGNVKKKKNVAFNPTAKVITFSF